MICHLKYVNSHVPLSAITDHVTREVINEAILKWTSSFLDGQLKVVIGLVQLIPEKYVRLRTALSIVRVTRRMRLCVPAIAGTPSG